MHRPLLPAAFAVLLLAAGNASAVVIDDFTGGVDFTYVDPSSPVTVNFSGPGPIGGSRQTWIARGPHSGTNLNTTSLDTGAGTLSVSITTYSETETRYGTRDVVNGSELDLALPGTATFEIVFASFSFGVDDRGGGVLVGLTDGAGTSLSSGWITKSSLIDLDTNDGGTLSLALSSFSNFGLFNGEIDGISFRLDDLAVDAVVSELRFSGVATAPEPGTAALLLLGALAAIRSSRARAGS